MHRLCMACADKKRRHHHGSFHAPTKSQRAPPPAPGATAARCTPPGRSQTTRRRHRCAAHAPAVSTCVGHDRAHCPNPRGSRRCSWRSTPCPCEQADALQRFVGSVSQVECQGKDLVAVTVYRIGVQEVTAWLKVQDRRIVELGRQLATFQPHTKTTTAHLAAESPEPYRTGSARSGIAPIPRRS